MEIIEILGYTSEYKVLRHLCWFLRHCGHIFLSTSKNILSQSISPSPVLIFLMVKYFHPGNIDHMNSCLYVIFAGFPAC